MREVLDDSKELVSISIERRDEETYSAPKQSANTLFRFFSKPEYLFESLAKQAMIPRYYGENVDYLNIGYNQIAYPMVCFCDITVHRLEDHMTLYGKYGIAFSKVWGIKQGIQPVQYVNKNSVLCKDFSTAFETAIQNEEDTPPVNFLLTQMLYMKPIEGTMPRGEEVIRKNFTDECEWRFIPNVASINLPQAVTESEIASVGVLNSTINDNPQCWLRFNFSDVKYIFLQTEENFDELCAVLDQVVDNEEEKRKLISKVIIWNNAREDF